jgi:hypothetical protein
LKMMLLSLQMVAAISLRIFHATQMKLKSG